MHIVACSLEVFLKTQQHVDTHPLVGFEHMVQGIVGQIEEDDRSQGEGTYPKVIAEARQQPADYHIQDKQDAQGEFYINNVEGNDEEREQQGQQSDADGSQGDVVSLATVDTVDVDKSGREELDEQ